MSGQRGRECWTRPPGVRRALAATRDLVVAGGWGRGLLAFMRWRREAQRVSGNERLGTSERVSVWVKRACVCVCIRKMSEMGHY